MKTLWTHDDSKTRDELDVINANHMAQNLYDHLTCAGIRHGLWPNEAQGDRLDEAFALIADYIAALEQA